MSARVDTDFLPGVGGAFGYFCQDEAGGAA